jgi:periplasmic divalent cation tolerance protein
MMIFAVTTVAKRRDAESLAGLLVKNSVAACVSVLPGTRSFYRWKGKFCREGEYLLFIKTSRRALPRLKKLLREHHPYELHELLAWEVKDGHEPYLNWVERECLGPGGKKGGRGR